MYELDLDLVAIGFIIMTVGIFIGNRLAWRKAFKMINSLINAYDSEREAKEEIVKWAKGICEKAIKGE